jgi:hypothetical protein
MTKLTRASIQLSESVHLFPVDVHASVGLGLQGRMGVGEEKDKVRAAVRCAMAAWRAMELNVRQVANGHARVVGQLQAMLLEAAPACRNREIASLTVPELLRLYSPGGPLHQAGKGNILGPCRIGRSAARRSATGGSSVSDQDVAEGAADRGGGRRREELREALWGWLSSAAVAPVACQKLPSAAACSVSMSAAVARREAGTGVDMAMQRVASLKSFLEQLAPLMPLLREGWVAAVGKEAPRKATGEAGDKKERGRVARQVAITSAYGASVPREGRRRGVSAGAAGNAAGATGTGSSGRGARERGGGHGLKSGLKVAADAHLLLGGMRATGEWRAGGELNDWEDGRWASGEWVPCYRHAQLTRANVPLCLGHHWLWEPKMDVQAVDSVCGGSVSGGMERGPKVKRDHLELMVPPRRDLPAKGLVPCRGPGGGAMRGRGLNVRLQPDNDQSASTRGEKTDTREAAAENLVVEGLEERARLMQEVQELAACVAAARESRLRRLHTVAVDLSRCSGVQWQGL